MVKSLAFWREHERRIDVCVCFVCFAVRRLLLVTSGYVFDNSGYLIIRLFQVEWQLNNMLQWESTHAAEHMGGTTNGGGGMGQPNNHRDNITQKCLPTCKQVLSNQVIAAAKSPLFSMHKRKREDCFRKKRHTNCHCWAGAHNKRIQQQEMDGRKKEKASCLNITTKTHRWSV